MGHLNIYIMDDFFGFLCNIAIFLSNKLYSYISSNLMIIGSLVTFFVFLGTIIRFLMVKTHLSGESLEDFTKELYRRDFWIKLFLMTTVFTLSLLPIKITLIQTSTNQLLPEEVLSVVFKNSDLNKKKVKGEIPLMVALPIKIIDFVTFGDKFENGKIDGFLTFLLSNDLFKKYKENPSYLFSQYYDFWKNIDKVNALSDIIFLKPENLSNIVSPYDNEETAIKILSDVVKNFKYQNVSAELNVKDIIAKLIYLFSIGYDEYLSKVGEKLIDDIKNNTFASNLDYYISVTKEADKQLGLAIKQKQFGSQVYQVIEVSNIITGNSQGDFLTFFMDNTGRGIDNGTSVFQDTFWYPLIKGLIIQSIFAENLESDSPLRKFFVNNEGNYNINVLLNDFLQSGHWYYAFTLFRIISLAKSGVYPKISLDALDKVLPNMQEALSGLQQKLEKRLIILDNLLSELKNNMLLKDFVPYISSLRKFYYIFNNDLKGILQGYDTVKSNLSEVKETVKEYSTAQGKEYLSLFEIFDKYGTLGSVGKAVFVAILWFLVYVLLFFSFLMIGYIYFMRSITFLVFFILWFLYFIKAMVKSEVSILYKTFLGWFIYRVFDIVFLLGILVNYLFLKILYYIKFTAPSILNSGLTISFAINSLLCIMIILNFLIIKNLHSAIVSIFENKEDTISQSLARVTDMGMAQIISTMSVFNSFRIVNDIFSKNIFQQKIQQNIAGGTPGSATGTAPVNRKLNK